MKQKITLAGIFLLLLFLFRYPQEALAASREGLSLWLNVLLPTLLPFLILTGFLIHTDGIRKIFDPLKQIWNKCFGLSGSGAYALVLGMLCGYPMGAKLASDLYQNKMIEKTEADYLLSFCSNPSPAFLITYLSEICLQGKIPLRVILAVLLTSDFICMIFFRFVVYKNKTISREPEISLKKETSITSSLGTIIDVSIMNGFETITRLGGYILLFSLLSAVLKHYWPFSPLSGNLLLGFLEITTGLHRIAESGLPLAYRFLFSMCAAAFGGLCITAQTRSVLDQHLSFRTYTAAKCMNAGLTAGILLIFFQIV